MVLKCVKCSVSAFITIWNVLQVWWSCNELILYNIGELSVKNGFEIVKIYLVEG